MGISFLVCTTLVVIFLKVDLIFTSLLCLWSTRAVLVALVNDDSSNTTTENILQLFHRFTFTSSQLDFIFPCLLRYALVLGGWLGVACNRTNGPSRVRFASTGVFCIFLTCLVYSPLKLLALTEETLVSFRIPWFWSLFSFNIIASSLAATLWTFVLGSVTDKSKIILVDATDETAVLVDNEVRANSDVENPNTKDVTKPAKEEEANVAKPTSLILRLLRYCRTEAWVFYMLGFLFLIFYSIARVFIPFYVGQVISDIVVTRSYSNLVTSALYMIGLSVSCSIFAGLRGGSFTYAMTKVNLKIRSDLFLSLVKQEIGFFDKAKTGDITSRLTSDCQTMSDSIALNVNIFLRSLIMLMGSLVFMVRLSWQLTLMIFIVIPLIGLVSKVYGKYYEKLSQDQQDGLARANEVSEEVLSSMRTVRSFANEIDESRRYDDKLGDVLKIGVKKAWAVTGYNAVSEFFDLFILACVLWYGGHLVLTGRIQSQDLISFILYQMQFGECISGMSAVYTGIMQAVGASRKVFELIDRNPLIPNDGMLQPKDLVGAIEFKNVKFAYPSRPTTTVLQDVSFRVNAGEIVALVGPSGGGKSSCFSLLEHFYEPLSGDILLDGHSVRLYQHSFFHRAISLVGQEPVMYARTISENVSYGLSKDEVKEEDVVEAAKMANAHGFVVALPSSYATYVGEKGVQISGGQKQRLAIARALIRHPKILLLDEATSALDAESEFLVQQALYSNLVGHTVLLIAHRLSTVEKADRIVVIDGGKVVQQGSHDQLLQIDGLYKNLVHRQLLGCGETAAAIDGEATIAQNPPAQFVEIRANTELSEHESSLPNSLKSI